MDLGHDLKTLAAAPAPGACDQNGDAERCCCELFIEHLYFSFASEAIHALVPAQVGKHRLPNGQPLAVDLPAFRQINLSAHPLA
jgi:hypothetical protein